MRRPAHRPRKMRGIIEDGCTRTDKEMGHLLLVDVFEHRHVGRRTDGIDEEQHFVAFDKASDLLDRLGWAIGVVEADEVDLAAVHAAVLVYHREIGRDRYRTRRIGRCRTAIGRGGPDLDFTIGGAGTVMLLCQSRRRGNCECRQSAERQMNSGGQESLLLLNGEATKCPPQFFSTTRPTTFPARNASIHFCTSGIGSSLIGVGLILPARASAISS